MITTLHGPVRGVCSWSTAFWRVGHDFVDSIVDLSCTRSANALNEVMMVSQRCCERVRNSLRLRHPLHLTYAPLQVVGGIVTEIQFEGQDYIDEFAFPIRDATFRPEMKWIIEDSAIDEKRYI